jgi:hypothetical protein
MNEGAETKFGRMNTLEIMTGTEATAGRRTKKRMDGVVIGLLTGFAESGEPLVAFPGNPNDDSVRARSTTPFDIGDIGAEVALMFEHCEPAHPLILGRILHPETTEAGAPAVKPSRKFEAQIADERLEFIAKREIVLRCGKASITLTRAGKILLRGAYISSRSSGVNKIKGGSIQLN